MLLTDADQLRKALAIAMRERDELHAFSKELESNVRRLARERDEARACLAFERVTVAELRAEVERLRGVEDCRGDGLTYECNLTRPCVTCRLRTVAERQREACAKQFEGEGASVSDRGNAKWVRATPLVTEVNK